MAKYGPVALSKDEWITPKYITEALGLFDLDPCAPAPENSPWQHATRAFYLPLHDGLKEYWEGRIWLNPPYLKQAAWPWLERLAEHKSGGIALVNSTTETAGFQKRVLSKAKSVFWLAGRLSFFHADGSPSNSSMQGSCLVSYNREDSNVLGACRLKGVHTWLY